MAVLPLSFFAFIFAYFLFSSLYLKNVLHGEVTVLQVEDQSGFDSMTN